MLSPYSTIVRVGEGKYQLGSLVRACLCVPVKVVNPTVSGVLVHHRPCVVSCHVCRLVLFVAPEHLVCPVTRVNGFVAGNAPSWRSSEMGRLSQCSLGVGSSTLYIMSSSCFSISSMVKTSRCMGRSRWSATSLAISSSGLYFHSRRYQFKLRSRLAHVTRDQGAVNSP